MASKDMTHANISESKFDEEQNIYTVSNITQQNSHLLQSKK